ncbi:sporulation YhaL family protein [Aliibacillus thermotolerans]|uniref:Sporulation YhaL family protein n=1 Tax=Aliibacillus thermotolerans TaxID=1834418 RepID=A0ABW0U9P6_9BACI|nr:signal peptidase [Aliibacillus thermotolerans]
MTTRSKRFIGALVVAFILLVTWQRFFETPGAQPPIWVVLAVFGIIFSGYMWRVTSKKEKEEEERWIEQEGRIYIRRMEKEKERRRLSS